VSHGSATIDQNGNTLTINQGTDRLIMGWHSFSIGQGETTRFVQPSSSSMALNRVNGGTRSMIEGRLEANGGVILINPAGITVTKSGMVNVNTFIGSTHDITDDEFLKGGALNFKGTSDASIENLGTIHAETGKNAKTPRDRFYLLSFWDYGLVNTIQPLPGNDPTYAISGVGFGARYALGVNFSMRCDLGFPLINPNVGISIAPTVALGATLGF